MSSQGFLKYFIAITIAFNLSTVKAQTEADSQVIFNDLQKRLASKWEHAVLTHSLEFATKIEAIAFSPDGRLLASVGAGKITVLNVDNGEIERILPGHYSSEIEMEIAPTAIAISPDSRFLATSTWSQGLLRPGQSIVVRNIATGEEVLSIDASGGCRQVLFDVSGEVIYGACQLGITAWNFPDGEKLFSFDAKYPVEKIALSPDGEIMATVDANVSGGQQGEKYDRIQLWQLTPQPKLVGTLDGHANEIARLEFTNDGQRLISSSYDGEINVWDWQQETIYRNTKNLYSDEGVFSLNADSSIIAGSFADSAMTDLITGLPLKNVPLSRQTSTFSFSPQEQLFASVKHRESTSELELWSIERSGSELSSTRDNYLTVPVSNWSSQTPSHRAISIGTDPIAIALSVSGLTEMTEVKPEVELDYPRDSLATVTITQTNLLDDSLAGIRYLAEFAPYGDRSFKKWQLVWLGRQFKCQQNRGDRDWSPNLCQ